MYKKILPFVLAATVGIILFANLLIPATEASMWATRTYSNVDQSAFYLMAAEDLEPGVYNYSYIAATDTLTMDGVEVNLPENYTWATFGLGMLRSGPSNFTATLTVTESAATLNYNGTSTFGLSAGDSWIIWNAPTEYIMTKIDNTGVYVSKNAPEIFAGLTVIDGVNHTFKLTCDGTENTFNNIVPATSTVDNVVINSAKIGDTKEVYKLTDVQFDCTTNTHATKHCTYSYGIAHTTVTGHNASDAAALGSIIPLLAIISLVVMGARVIAARRA